MAIVEKDFIKQNREFWSVFAPKQSRKKLLVEEPSRVPMIVHTNSIFSIILNKARDLSPVWLHNDSGDIELLKSYVPIATTFSIPSLSLFERIKLKMTGILKFVKMYLTGHILSFSYDGVRYGDIVYDTYLSQAEVATIRKIDRRILSIICACISRHEQIKKALSTDRFEAVLVSHQVGIRSGVILRVALRYGYIGYSRAGHHQSTLRCFNALDEVYDYVYKPFPDDVDAVIAGLGADFDTVYKRVFDRQVSGKGSTDGMYAFSADNKYYRDRQSFVNDFGLDSNKKNVFVVLHAFNDYPHSHFRWMIFRDYYDWFIKTLEFAKTNDKVNWVFKQHPSIKLYTTRDVEFDRIFFNIPKHIVYIGEDKQIDTRSLEYCADLVVTCLGSAGFELPAMAGIPSLIAGDSHYTGLGFTLEPRTKQEYFEILGNATNIAKLTAEQQKRARAAYMHIYEFSMVNMSACPISTAEKEKDKNQKLWYYDAVAELYRNCGDTIKREINNYIAAVAKPGFKQLNSLQDYCRRNSKSDRTRDIRITSGT